MFIVFTYFHLHYVTHFQYKYTKIIKKHTRSVHLCISFYDQTKDNEYVYVLDTPPPPPPPSSIRNLEQLTGHFTRDAALCS